MSNPVYLKKVIIDNVEGWTIEDKYGRSFDIPGNVPDDNIELFKFIWDSGIGEAIDILTNLLENKVGIFINKTFYEDNKLPKLNESERERRLKSIQ